MLCGPDSVDDPGNSTPVMLGFVGLVHHWEALSIKLYPDFPRYIRGFDQQQANGGRH